MVSGTVAVTSDWEYECVRVGVNDSVVDVRTNGVSKTVAVTSDWEYECVRDRVCECVGVGVNGGVVALCVDGERHSCGIGQWKC
jgi:hypothetical protein